MLAKHVLYQLSYTPGPLVRLQAQSLRSDTFGIAGIKKSRAGGRLFLVGPGRVELPTSTLSV